MRKPFLSIAAATLAACSSPAITQPATGVPKLVIVISVDQLSADLWDEYRSQFTGGFARLASGTVFRNGYQSHATTETCLGHSTILTGDRPSRTGIVGNVWFDPKAPRTDKTIYCAEDESISGTNSTNYKVSAVHLRVPTLGEFLKQRNPASLNVAVAGKDRSAVMMGGHVADQRWYFDGNQFSTDLSGRPIPRSVQALNQTLPQTISAGVPALEPTPFCAGKAQVYPIAGGGKPVGNGTLARSPGDSASFRATPQFDGATLALAAGLVQELGLGRDPTTDVLSVGLSATDFVGHTYGPGGQEMCLQLLSLDRELGDFFSRLDSWGIDYAVALTADHGALDIPERLRAKGVTDAAWIDPALRVEAIGAKAAAAAHLKGNVIAAGGPSGDVYLDPALKGADRTRAQAALIAAYRANPQVQAVFTKDEIASAAAPSGDPRQWPLIQRIKASFDTERSGDLYVVLKPHIQPIADTSRYVSTHGSPWDYDRRVPIVFWRAGMASSNREESAETVDIMPTLAALLELRTVAPTVDGHCLQNVPGVTCDAR
jgi:predicted AlkP superfamily pyrophosphatase or phosphodiesterase